MAAVLALFTAAAPLCADPSADIRAQVSYIATALTSGNPTDAMTPFDKAFSDYDKLSRYFEGLGAFQVQNEIDFIDEQDSETEARLTVHWGLTLTDQATDATERRGRRRKRATETGTRKMEDHCVLADQLVQPAPEGLGKAERLTKRLQLSVVPPGHELKFDGQSRKTLQFFRHI